MTALPWLICAVAAIVATVCSTVDGALLSFGPPVQTPAGPAPLIRDRERAHRALTMMRVLAHLTAGAYIARGATLLARPFALRVLIALSFAIALVALTEGAARSIGYGLGSASVGPLMRIVRVVEIILAPAVALGGWIERLLQRLLPSGAHK